MGSHAPGSRLPEDAARAALRTSHPGNKGCKVCLPVRFYCICIVHDLDRTSGPSPSTGPRPQGRDTHGHTQVCTLRPLRNVYEELEDRWCWRPLAFCDPLFDARLTQGWECLSPGKGDQDEGGAGAPVPKTSHPGQCPQFLQGPRVQGR